MVDCNVKWVKYESLIKWLCGWKTNGWFWSKIDKTIAFPNPNKNSNFAIVIVKFKIFELNWQTVQSHFKPIERYRSDRKLKYRTLQVQGPPTSKSNRTIHSLSGILEFNFRCVVACNFRITKQLGAQNCMGISWSL